MNRTIKAVVCGVAGLGGLAAVGCHTGDKEHSHKYGDPCWPERYASQARALTVANFEPQVTNGHILDLTIWNMHFEAGTDKLNAAGMDKLDQLARRRPAPDPVVYLQTTRDIGYDAGKPNAYGTTRTDLDTKRTEAIQKYLAATLTGRGPMTFTVQIHDPAPPGIDGAEPRVIVPSPRTRVGGGTGPGANGIGSPGATSSTGGASSALNPVPTPAPAPQPGPGM